MPEKMLLSVLDLLGELTANQKEIASRVSAFGDALLEPEIDDFVGRFRKNYYACLRSIPERGEGEDKLLAPIARVESAILQLRQTISRSS